jgi:hypothetical protein
MFNPTEAADYFDAWRQVVAERLDGVALGPRPIPAPALGTLDAIGRTAVAIGCALGPATDYDPPPDERIRLALDGRRHPCPAGVLGAMADLRDVLGPLPVPGPARCAAARGLIVAGHDLALLAAEHRALLLLADALAGQIVGDPLNR